MAVQAQFASNILVSNRGGPEGLDYPLQPQAGGLTNLDQHHMIINNGTDSTNPRKFACSGTLASPLNTFCMQSQPPSQLVDFAKLHSHHHHNVVSTGLRLFSADQKQQQSLNFGNSSILFSEDFTSHVKQQSEQIDQFLQAQGEQLRRTLAEKRQKHYRELLGAAGELVMRRMREKDDELERATRRNSELEARAAQLGVEVQAWQAKVRAQEATAASLQAQLHQAIMVVPSEDGGLGSAGLEGQAEDSESVYIDLDRVVVSGPDYKPHIDQERSALFEPSCKVVHNVIAMALQSSKKM